MKRYNQEPKISELLKQLENEAEMPDFIPPIKIPVFGKFISKQIIKAMVRSFAGTLIS